MSSSSQRRRPSPWRQLPAGAAPARPSVPRGAPRPPPARRRRQGHAEHGEEHGEQAMRASVAGEVAPQRQALSPICKHPGRPLLARTLEICRMSGWAARGSGGQADATSTGTPASWLVPRRVHRRRWRHDADVRTGVRRRDAQTRPRAIVPPSMRHAHDAGPKPVREFRSDLDSPLAELSRTVCPSASDRSAASGICSVHRGLPFTSTGGCASRSCSTAAFDG